MGCASSNGQAAPAPPKSPSGQDAGTEKERQTDSEGEPETQLEAPPIIKITPPDEATKVRHELLADPASETNDFIAPTSYSIRPDNISLQGEDGKCRGLFICCAGAG
ncbi:unnamed protein product [Symbiodinium sp. CCMP2592]|nr:unnamed protein product [Symbiodinium sp. CCMP2592]